MKLWRRIYDERKRFVLPLVVLLVGNLAVLLLAVVPLARVVAVASNTREEAGLKLRDARVLEIQAKNQRTSKIRADEELKKFYAEILPTSMTAKNSAYFWPIITAQGTRLVAKGAINNPEQIKGSTLVRYATKVTLTGEYPSIQKFLYELETSEHFLIVERVTLAPASISMGATGGSLELVLDVVTYYVAPPGGVQSSGSSAPLGAGGLR